MECSVASQKGGAGAIEHIHAQIEQKATKVVADPKRASYSVKNPVGKAISQSIPLESAGKGKVTAETLLGGKTKTQKVDLIIQDKDLLNYGKLKMKYDALAPTTRMSYASEVKFYVNICEKMNCVPWLFKKKILGCCCGCA